MWNEYEIFNHILLIEISIFYLLLGRSANNIRPSCVKGNAESPWMTPGSLSSFRAVERVLCTENMSNPQLGIRSGPRSLPAGVFTPSCQTRRWWRWEIATPAGPSPPLQHIWRASVLICNHNPTYFWFNHTSPKGAIKCSAGCAAVSSVFRGVHRHLHPHRRWPPCPLSGPARGILRNADLWRRWKLFLLPHCLFLSSSHAHSRMGASGSASWRTCERSCKVGEPTVRRARCDKPRPCERRRPGVTPVGARPLSTGRKCLRKC